MANPRNLLIAGVSIATAMAGLFYCKSRSKPAKTEEKAQDEAEQLNKANKPFEEEYIVYKSQEEHDHPEWGFRGKPSK